MSFLNNLLGKRQNPAEQVKVISVRRSDSFDLDGKNSVVVSDANAEVLLSLILEIEGASESELKAIQNKQGVSLTTANGLCKSQMIGVLTKPMLCLLFVSKVPREARNFTLTTKGYQSIAIIASDDIYKKIGFNDMFS